jgi:predicted O-linked N-acetylglucosamine transferase (SPINDLY family)
MPEPRLTGRRRIGFVVTRLHEGIFLRSLRGVLQHMDPAAFELVVICQQEGEAKLRSSFDCSHVQVLVMPDRINAVVELLSRECFDILYYWEVGTDAMNYCLPFYRLAPIQCTSWGVQVTTGIPNMDYYLSSGLVEPDGADAKYTETLVCADTLLTYQYRMTLPDKVKRREDFGFSGSHHLYLFPQQIGKFHPDFDAVAKDILRRDPQGRLVILKDRWEYSAARLTERLKRSAGDVMDRVVFLPRLDHADYLGLVAAADVLLDPPCYGGVNSSYDGFSLGKPIVTVETDFHIGRYTAGCYRKMGLADCLASSPGDYADIAVRLGTDRDWREEVGERIVSASAALFEDMRAVREHERIFSELLDTL